MARPIVTLVAVATILSLGILGQRSYRQIYARRDVYRVVDAAGLQHAIVLLKTASADMVRLDLNRNPPAFEQSVVRYGLSRPGLDDEVADANPGWTLYYYEWREQGGRVWPASPEELRRAASAPATPAKHP